MATAAKLHRIRFYEPTTLGSINSIALDETIKKLAVLRRSISRGKSVRAMSTSTIEIWDTTNESAPFLDTVIHENDDAPGLLECVAWGRDSRLFSCGLDGNMNEYDLIKNGIKKKTAVGSGAVWCMSFNMDKSLVALGTENGDLCVYDIDPTKGDEVNFVKSFPKWNSRILCVAWYEAKEKKTIVTGSQMFIAIWDFENGRCTERIRVGNKHTQVWCLAVLGDFTIVSGDSQGNTSFWDGKSATSIKTFQTHGADVLSMCRYKNLVFVSGIDPKIVQFAIDADGQPVQSLSFNNHTHDVRTLCATSSGWLLSGSVDSFLIKSYPNPKQVNYYTQNFVDNVVACEDLVLMRHRKSVDVWEINREVAYSTAINTQNTVRRVANIESRRCVVCANLSSSWVAYATTKELVVLHRTPSKISRVEIMSEPIVGAVERILFIREKFLCASTGTTIYVFSLDPMGIVFERKLTFKKKHVQGMTALDDYLAVVLSDHSIDVTKTTTWESEHKIQLPSLPTALAFNPFRTRELWMTLPNLTLTCHDICEKQSKKTFKTQSDQYSAFRGICFTSESVIVYDDNSFYSLDATTGVVRAVNNAYKHIAKMGNLTSKGHELYLVEVTPETIFRRLPDAYAKKRFGT